MEQPREPDGCTLNFSIDQDVLVLVCDGTRSTMMNLTPTGFQALVEAAA